MGWSHLPGNCPALKSPVAAAQRNAKEQTAHLLPSGVWRQNLDQIRSPAWRGPQKEEVTGWSKMVNRCREPGSQHEGGPGPSAGCVVLVVDPLAWCPVRLRLGFLVYSTGAAAFRPGSEA